MLDTTGIFDMDGEKEKFKDAGQATFPIHILSLESVMSPRHVCAGSAQVRPICIRRHSLPSSTTF